MEHVLTRDGLTLMIAATDDESRRESAIVSVMLARRIRALLLVPIAADHSYLEAERQFGTPIVAVDRPLTNAVSDNVVFDNRHGARAGVEALIEARHRAIAFVGSTDSLYTHRERLAGYRDALAGAGLTVDPALVRTDGPDIDSAERAARWLLEPESPPTAVFAGNNRAAIGVLHAGRGLDRDIGVLGFDDVELGDLVGLSVVAHDPAEMGAVAAELALSRIRHTTGVAEQVILPTRLILRGSDRRGLPRHAALR